MVKEVRAKHRIKKKANSPNFTNFRALVILAALSFLAILTIIYLQIKLNFIDADGNSNDHETISDDLQLAIQPFHGDSFFIGNIFETGPVWGSLNSGHFFGLKLTSPSSIETSLMWFKNELNQDGSLIIRHLCDQNNRLKFYSWTRHDFHTFGEQTIQDQEYQIKTNFLKSSNKPLDWTAEIEVKSDSGRQIDPISLVQYITTIDPYDKLAIEWNNQKVGNSEQFSIRGISKDIGPFRLIIKGNSSAQIVLYTTFFSGKYDPSQNTVSNFIHGRMTSIKHDGKRLYVLPGRANHQKLNDNKPDNNIIAYQLVVKPPASIRVQFLQGDDEILNDDDNFDVAFSNKVNEFDLKFSQKFPLTSLKMDVNSTLIDRLAKIALSNMIGSIGYFYGSSYISSATSPNKIVPYGPIQLLTGVPSRSFFPRGFLWDEGFHNLLISRWDSGLSNKIIKSWFDLMNINGWIPREVILGSESLRRVPHEFIVQYIDNANPPAMMLVIDQMLDHQTLESETLESIYPKLKAWFRWLNITQSGTKKSTFRWRGRDENTISMLNPKTLTSGLDDYPRASHPSAFEYHLDLRCWLAHSASILSKLSQKMHDTSYTVQIQPQLEELYNNELLDLLHWNEEHQMYCDYGHHTADAELILVTKTRKSRHGGLETYQVLERHSTGNPNFGCVPEFGYVSLFPLMLKVLDHRSRKLGIILDRMRDENELWSPYGIRSLSKSSRYYNKFNTQHDKPYWRGAVWLNLNYLILSSLKSYSILDGPYKEKCAKLFIELKLNLVDNVLREFSRTNYMWENYDDQTGHGKGSHPFTGWSSLILLIMSSNLD